MSDETDKKTIHPHFASADKVRLVCENLQDVERIRAKDRALIDTLANGKRPYTPEEVEKNQIKINANFGELCKHCQDANAQVNNATIHTGYYFTAKSLGGKIEKRDEYGAKFTKNIHKPLKRHKSGKKYLYLMRSRNASFCLHGIGVLMWTNDFDWMPRFVPLEDLLIPTDTTLDLCNLTHLAVNLYLTPGELYDMTQGEKTDKGWDKKAVKEILIALKDDKNMPVIDDNDVGLWNDQPEKMQEWFKQNSGYLYSDAVPKVRLRLFLFQDPENKKWYRRIILRESIADVEVSKEFLYNGKDTPFADDIDHILHIQFGDNSIVPPLKYHSVRGLGTMLYAVCELMNRLRCQFFQHVFEQLLMYFRINDPIDRDRLKKIELMQYGIIPEGMQIIPQAERHQVDSQLVESAMSEGRQLTSESAASFVQDIDNGTNKEMTATETTARLQSVNQMVSAMLQMMYSQEVFLHEEEVRRFCNKTSADPQVKEFRKQCKKDGIPDELMEADNWLIECEKVLGGGDRTLANQEADALLSQSQRYDTDAQRNILRMWTSIKTNDPAKGDMLVPQKPADATDGTFAAEDVFSTLMQGLEVHLREGISQEDYIRTMIGMLGGKIQLIQQSGGIATPPELMGLQAVAQDIAKHIALIEPDKSKQLEVKTFKDELGKLENAVKAFAQQLQQQAEAQQAESADNPEVQAKVQGMVLQAQTKAQITEANAQQKQAQKDAQFQAKMQQDMEKFQADMQKMVATAQAELAAAGVKAGQEIAIARQKAESEIAIMKEKAAAAPKPQPAEKK